MGAGTRPGATCKGGWDVSLLLWKGTRARRGVLRGVGVAHVQGRVGRLRCNTSKVLSPTQGCDMSKVLRPPWGCDMRKVLSPPQGAAACTAHACTSVQQGVPMVIALCVLVGQGLKPRGHSRLQCLWTAIQRYAFRTGPGALRRCRCVVYDVCVSGLYRMTCGWLSTLTGWAPG
jgi:hypothetical protein